MLKINNLSFSYSNEPLLKNFSIEIPLCSKVALVGESGSGKSTFINLLCGFELPEKGEIYYENIQLNYQNINLIRQKIAWLPQNINLPFENIKDLFFSIFQTRVNKKIMPRQSEIDNILRLFQIENDLLDKKNDEISGGQKQRLMLAAVLLTKKKYIFLDEPTSSLDEQNTEKVTDYILGLNQSTIFFATHDKKIIEKADIIINFPNI